MLECAPQAGVAFSRPWLGLAGGQFRCIDELGCRWAPSSTYHRCLITACRGDNQTLSDWRSVSDASVTSSFSSLLIIDQSSPTHPQYFWIPKQLSVATTASQPPAEYQFQQQLSLTHISARHICTEVREWLWYSKCHNASRAAGGWIDVDDLQAQAVVDQLLHRHRRSGRARRALKLPTMASLSMHRRRHEVVRRRDDGVLDMMVPTCIAVIVVESVEGSSYGAPRPARSYRPPPEA
jgi:hypothetical protein